MGQILHELSKLNELNSPALVSHELRVHTFESYKY